MKLSLVAALAVLALAAAVPSLTTVPVATAAAATTQTLTTTARNQKNTPAPTTTTTTKPPRKTVWKKPAPVNKPAPKNPPPKNPAPKKQAPKKNPPPKKQAPKKQAPKKNPAPKKQAPKKQAPKKQAPKKQAPKKQAPKKQAPKKNPPPKKQAPKKQAPRKPAASKPKPKPRRCAASVCFALDGSVSTDEFSNQKKLVLEIGNRVSSRGGSLAAAQYATAVTEIQSLTPDWGLFMRRVTATEQTQGASFVTAGVNYCFVQLFRVPGPKQIVVLVDGASNIGASAATRTGLFTRLGGSVSVVGAGFGNDAELVSIAGGRNNVFKINDFMDVPGMVRTIDNVVRNICD